ncbi:MAG: cytochrome c [Nitrospirales bacterium]|nr:cytochrome c [Nitrospira sp.]MDR4459256.1 cytochrome c [Nitrospirales bacterium]MDR4483211.1 cytochrome c [Nitrospirales bacterium]
MLRRIKILFIIFLSLLVVALLTALWLLPGMFSAKATPPEWEVKAARFIRHLATPSHFLKMTNPVPYSSEALAEARHHFADHCATCHANDGSGKTHMGPNFYPPVPDLRDPIIQAMADGELFYVIHYGIRFTGMPAWGKGLPEKDHDSWQLVHLIRHFPNITPEEIAEMKQYNPLTPEERERQETLDQFLSGEDVVPQEHHH